MPTTSQGIYYPDSATNVTPLHTVLATMASSIETILDGDTQIHRVADTTQRAALATSFGPTSAKPLFVWRANAANGRQLEYTKNGTTWYYVTTSEDYASTGGGLIARVGSWVADRIGNTVTVRWLCTSSFPANDAALPLFTLPVGWRPTGDIAAAVGGTSLYPWTGVVRTSGDVQVRNNHSGAQSNMIGSATFLV